MRLVATAVMCLATALIVVVPFFNGTTLLICSAQPRTESARKFDEYGDLIQDDERVRLSAFAAGLAGNRDARGYILVYGGRLDPVGRARRYALRAKNFLVDTEGLTSNRIVTIDGGQRESLTVELWIVPSNAEPPIPTPTLDLRPGHENKAWEFDEYPYDYEFSWNSFETPSVRLDGFAQWLRSHPTSKGYIIVYALNRDDRRGVQGDRFGKAKRIALAEKTYLTKTQHIDPRRLVAVDAGYSNERTVELWIVPGGASPPSMPGRRRTVPRTD